MDAVSDPHVTDTQNQGRLEPGGAEAPDDTETPSAAASGGSAEAGTENPGLTDGNPDGVATGNLTRPRIDDLSDRRVLRGEGVLLSGARLLPNPSVLLGNRAIAPVDASLTALKFIVPEDLPLVRCEVTFRLLVKTDLGLSPSTEIAVLKDPPQLSVTEPRVAAGGELRPRLGPEGEGTLQLESPGQTPVRLVLSSGGSVTIPPDTPEGPALLRWTTPCGEAVAPLDVQLGAP